MALTDPQPDPGDPARLAEEIERTVDRLRTMSVVRLAAPLPGGASRAAAAFGLAQELADRAAALAGRPLRRLPDLPDLAAGDVLAVCGHDLVEVLTDHPDAAGCREAVGKVTSLRRTL